MAPARPSGETDEMPGLGLTEVVRRVAAALATAALTGASWGRPPATVEPNGGRNDRVPPLPAGCVGGGRRRAEPVRDQGGRDGPPASDVARLAGLLPLMVAGREPDRLHGPKFALARPPRRHRARASLFGPAPKSLLPTWSPDGKAIAVLAEDAESGIAEIYVVPTGGGAPRRLGVGDVRDPSWSPRGDEIAYASPTGTSGPSAAMAATSG